MNRQKAYLLILLIPMQMLLKAQTAVDTLPHLLLALDDTIALYQNNLLLNKTSLRSIKDKTGEIQLDLDKERGDWSNTYLLCTKGDTLAVQQDSERALYLTVTNGLDTVRVLLNFYNNTPSFSQEYQNLHRQEVQFAIPAVYELVHVALSMTDGGRSAGETFDLRTFYAGETVEYFNRYGHHPLIRHLDRLIAASSFDQLLQDLTRYSLPLIFQHKQIIRNSVYPMPYRINPWSGDLLKLLQDFSDQSGFLDFVEKNKGYHEKLLHEQQQFVNLDSLWTWLETQYPGRIDSYKILFSPLAGKRLDHQLFASDEFKEYVLFLDNPERFIQRPGSNNFKKNRMLKKVFDEIMPFYQKPLIEKNIALIRQSFSNRSAWLANGLNAEPKEVFQTYMSNAVFCLWAEEKYPSSQARLIRQEIEEEMLSKGYIRFYTFSRQLTGLFRQYGGDKKLADLYVELLKSN